MRSRSIEMLKTGDWAEFTKTISEADVYLFAGVTGDLNPAHVDESYARTTFFKTRIAHGMLLAGLISTVIGTQLPGPGTIYVRQELDFLAPVRFGDTVTARAEIVEILPDKNRVRLKTTCVNQDGKPVVDGVALVSPPKKKEK